MLFELAQNNAPAAPSGGAGWMQMLFTLWPILAIVLIMYWMVIRPQRQKEKRRQAMLKTVRKNDHVVTIGGIHGIVKNTSDTDIILLVDEKRDLTLKFNRSAIYTVVDREEAGELPRDDDNR